MSGILIVDEQSSLRQNLARMAVLAGHELEHVTSRTAAMDRLHRSQFDVVITDLAVGWPNTLDLLGVTRSMRPSAAVILVSPAGSIRLAVEALQIGAFDFVQKPFEIQEMEFRIAKAIAFRRLQHQVDYLRHTQQDIYNVDRIVGATGGLRNVLAHVKRIARASSNILIRGEAGTGKKLIAAAIHHNSPRASRAFVRVNCASLAEHRLESDLFGHEQGAFPGAEQTRISRLEQADGGTLLLDAVDQMSARTQARILQVLEKGEFERLGGRRSLQVDVRIMVSASRDLAALVDDGAFSKDLYDCLNGAAIDVPPLRERKQDIPALAKLFVHRFSSDFNKTIERATPRTLKALNRYAWPGNVCELENVMERAVLLARGPEIEPDDVQLGDGPPTVTTSDGDSNAVIRIPRTGLQLKEVERQVLEEALRRSSWVQKDAAELVGISSRVMSYKIRQLGIERPPLQERVLRHMRQARIAL